MRSVRLTPPVPGHTTEAELVTEFLFFKAIHLNRAFDQARTEFFRTLPPGLSPRFGRSAKTWKGYLETNIQAGLVNGQQGVLTQLGRDHLDGLRDEAKTRGIKLPD